MRFADDYSGRLLVASDGLNSATNVISRIDLVRLKLHLVGGCMAVATGPNATMNLLDMLVLVVLARTVVEEQWVPGTYGESARPLLEACRQGETNITAIATTVLKPEQVAELQSAITQWRLHHPDLRGAVFTRALGLAVELEGSRDSTESPSGSVFGLLRLDPLAGLDPPARELAETRLFAERALFLSQRKPMLLRWQAELFALEIAETPVLREARTNSLQIAAAMERTSKVMEEFPALVRSEREAILKAVASQEPGLTNVAAQVKATLDAGRQMSDSVNTALTTFQRLQESLKTEDPKPPSQAGTPPEPFRIKDYAETAQRIDAAAERLTGLLRALDQTLGSTNLTLLSMQVAPVVQQVQTGGRDVVDYAFRKAVLLVAITCALVVVSALLFQRLRRQRTSS